MKNVFPALIIDDQSPDKTTCLEELLNFFNIPFETRAGDDGAWSNGDVLKGRTILAPLDVASQWLERRNEFRNGDKLAAAGSAFFYCSSEPVSADRSLAAITGDEEDRIGDGDQKSLEASVCRDWPLLTGPLQGLRVNLEPRPGDRVAQIKPKADVSQIISSERGSHFFSCDTNAGRAFVNASSEVPDLDQTISSKNYDVRGHFLSAVPIVMFLKWAFRGTCWEASEAGACFIVDDPLLRTNYGFCDFRKLDQQMKGRSFSTNIAMIPWNSRRTSDEMASLINESSGRLSVSVHGCDHTAREFGEDDPEQMNRKVGTAKSRMTEHRAATGVAHDSIMVFPQGIFSRESLAALQRHGFMAAVNTEPLPFPPGNERLTVRDAWSVAIESYGSFPLFTRRYPNDGIENFAFDLLLGKPCLVVEHHNFYKGEHEQVVRFAETLNALNHDLHWRSLGDVIKRSHQLRNGTDGAVHVRMFANEMLLENRDEAVREYRVEKADEGSAGVREVTADGQAIEWKSDGRVLVFRYEIPARGSILIAVRYAPPEALNGQEKISLNCSMKIAARRYLSEFRDNFLSRHEGLLEVAQRAKKLLTGAKG